MAVLTGTAAVAFTDADPLVRGNGSATDDLTRPVLRTYAAEQLHLPYGTPAPAPAA